MCVICQDHCVCFEHTQVSYIPSGRSATPGALHSLGIMWWTQCVLLLDNTDGRSQLEFRVTVPLYILEKGASSVLTY